MCWVPDSAHNSPKPTAEVSEGKAAEKKTADPGELIIKPVPVKEVWRLQKPEMGVLIIGTLASVVNGAVMPVRALLIPRGICVGVVERFCPVSDVHCRVLLWCLRPS